MEISNLSDAEFKTLVIRMLKELCEDLNSIKKIPSETKDTLIEIRTIYREITVERIKLRVKSMIWNTRKQKTTNQNNKKTKRIQRKVINRVRSLWDNFMFLHSYHRGAKRRTERTRNWKSI